MRAYKARKERGICKQITIKMNGKISKNHFTKSNLKSVVKSMTAMLAKLSVILSVLCINGCITKTEKYGYMFDMADKHLLEEGISSREMVQKIMGSPTIISDFGNDESWIYYSEKTEAILFFSPKIVDRQVLAIRFDNLGVAKKIENFDINDEQKNLQFSLNQTSVPEHQVGFFKSFVSNVGQVKPQ
jgi:outer membrane protein assembly factor BamE (lipoprotein component of BamABCDE complex)